MGSVFGGLVDLAAQNADVGQVAVLLGIVKAIADNKLVRYLGAAVIGHEINLSAVHIFHLVTCIANPKVGVADKRDAKFFFVGKRKKYCNCLFLRIDFINFLLKNSLED